MDTACEVSESGERFLNSLIAFVEENAARLLSGTALFKMHWTSDCTVKCYFVATIRLITSLRCVWPLSGQLILKLHPRGLEYLIYRLGELDEVQQLKGATANSMSWILLRGCS